MKQDRAHLRHVSFYYFIRPAVRLFLWLTFRYRTPEKVEDSGPFVMICNHVTDLDMLFTYLSTYLYIPLYMVPCL